MQNLLFLYMYIYLYIVMNKKISAVTFKYDGYFYCKEKDLSILQIYFLLFLQNLNCLGKSCVLRRIIQASFNTTVPYHFQSGPWIQVRLSRLLSV